MSKDANRWIISTHKYVEHKTPDAALVELMRLQRKCPKKDFHVYRIKREVELDAATKIIVGDHAPETANYQHQLAAVASEMERRDV